MEKLSAALLSIGLKFGDHVMLWGGNHAYLIVSVFACAKVGIVFSCVNPALTANALANHLALVSRLHWN